HMTENKEKLEIQEQDYQGRIHQLEIQEQKEREQFEKVKKEMHACSKKMAELRDSLSYGLEDIRAEIDNKKSYYNEYLNQQSVLQNEKQSIEKELEQLKYKERKQTEAHQELLNEEK